MVCARAARGALAALPYLYYAESSVGILRLHQRTAQAPTSVATMQFAVVAAVSAATTAALPWRVLRHTDCGLHGASHGVMVWGVSFEACLAKASTEAKGGFMYTNERWHGSAGCATGLTPPTNASCGSAGPDGNWDSYFCEAPDGKCATPVAPPQPPPPTPCTNITTQANCTAQSHRCTWSSGHCATAPAPPLSPTTEPCSAPGLLSTDGPNILTIGDSISMCGFGYGHFVNDMLVTQTQGRLAGYSSACGQMASTANSAEKMANCIGNSTGTLKGRPFSVITYNAGLHDCDTAERVHADAYRLNLKAGLEVLKAAAHAVAVTTTTPFDINVQKPDADAGINMSCVLEYNVIAKEVAAEVGASVVDLYGYVEEFCQQGPGSPNAKWPPLLPSSSGFGGNYTACAVQSSGLHFFTAAPQPSGQQYTGLHIAAEATRMIPNAHINNKTEEAARGVLERVSDAPIETMSCGNPPAPLSTTLPNVLIIGDSISEPGSGYGPGVEQLLMRPGIPWRNQSGPLASVQHNGNSVSNQAGPTTNGVNCIKSWVGKEKWDAITINFGIHDWCETNCPVEPLVPPPARHRGFTKPLVQLSDYCVRGTGTCMQLPPEGECQPGSVHQESWRHLRSRPRSIGSRRQDSLGVDHPCADSRRRCPTVLHLWAQWLRLQFMHR